MGMGIGIAIGWPNATPVLRSGWFEVLLVCNGGILPLNSWTFYQTDVDWVEGQYVYAIGYNSRVKLGAFWITDPGVVNLVQVSGPPYNSCEI